MTLTIDAAELRRIALAVEKSAAKDNSRPVLAGIHASAKGDRLTPARPAYTSSHLGAQKLPRSPSGQQNLPRVETQASSLPH